MNTISGGVKVDCQVDGLDEPCVANLIEFICDGIPKEIPEKPRPFWIAIVQLPAKESAEFIKNIQFGRKETQITFNTDDKSVSGVAKLHMNMTSATFNSPDGHDYLFAVFVGASCLQEIPSQQ